MNKLKLILHIGAGKTGTTALQSFLKINQSMLHHNGVHYMESPQWGDNSHHLLGFALWGKEHLALPNIPDIDFKSLEQKMVAELNKLPKNIHTVIISSEILFEIAGSPKIAPLKEFIKTNFAETKIIAYLRRQDEHIQSLYQHWIKTGHKQFRGKTIGEFIRDFKGDDYYEKLSAWAQHFGKETLQVKVYEKSQFKQNNIFADFLDTFQVEISDDFNLPGNDNSNLSINPEATEILRLCKSFDYNQLKEIWPDSTKPNLTGYSLLSAEEKLKVIEKYKASNQKVAQEFLGKQDGELFLAPLPEKPELTNTNNEMPFEFMVPTLMNIFQNQHEQIKGLEDQLNKILKLTGQLTEEISDLKNQIKQPDGPQVIFNLNHQNYNTINVSFDVESLTWKNNELRVISSGTDPNLFFNIPFKTDKTYALKVILNASENTTSQLFFSTQDEKGFSEKNSIVVKSEQGLNEHLFKLPQKNLFSKLRFDPSNTSGTFIIKSFTIIED